MKVADELRYLSTGTNTNDRIEGIGIVRFNVYCPGNANDVLRKCREVLEVVLKESCSKWPSDDTWKKLLPEWFVKRCPQEESEEKTEQWLNWWRGLSPEEQNRVNQESEWVLSDWIDWFRPDERQWFWWDAVVENENLLRVDVQIKEFPFPWGTLDWLLRASGAAFVEEES